MMSMENSTPELIEFPCDFEFKAFGPNDDAFRIAILEAVAPIQPVSRHALKERASGSGSYRCITLLLRIESRDHLHEVYRQLRSVEGLRYLL